MGIQIHCILCWIVAFTLVFPTSRVGADLKVLEAESGLLSDVSIQQNHPGYEGFGYGVYNDLDGGSIQWTYIAGLSGYVKLSLRYASIDDRPLNLYVDNIPKHLFSCTSTTGWSEWRTESAMISLAQGSHSFRLEAPVRGPNVDFLSIYFIGDSLGNKFETSLTDLLTVASRRTIDATSIYQAEAAASSNKIIIATAPLGFDGRGYADFSGIGAYLRWIVRVSNTTSYDIEARYAAANARKCNLYVDGQLKGAFFFAGKGTWSSWDFETRTVSLSQGEHEIMIRADQSAGPNLDWISVTPSCTAPNACTTPRTPTRSPVTKLPTVAQAVTFPSRVVVGSNMRMDKGQFVSSPNGAFKVGLTNQGDLVLQRQTGQTIWSAGAANRGHRLFVQSDGNAILRATNNSAIWSSKSYGHAGAQLTIDDGGRIAVTLGARAIWLDGIPRGVYRGRPNANLPFPVRGMFYYPWYPETWTVNGKQVRFVPDLGLYSSSDPAIFENHIDKLEYAWTDLMICSWWGPNTNQDRGRITMMLDALVASGSTVRLSIYHETEFKQRPSSARIKADLDYLKKWYAWHPAFAHINDRPVIFVFNDVGCSTVERWMAASNREWYVVLKLFPGFKNCAVQPDHWHQYGVAPDGNPISYLGYSTTIAPGFWRADVAAPLVPRLSKQKFCDNVQTMVARNEPWQLVLSFNEHGEATGVESTPNWASTSGYGHYLDCLHLYY